MAWTFKDPDEVLDYQIDWSTRLDSGDTITGTATWVVPSGITKDSQANTTTVATITLSGGTADTQYSLSCTVTTTNGRTHQEFAQVLVVNKAAVSAIDATVGGASANSYGTLGGYYTYAIDRGWDIGTSPAQNLIRAADIIDGKYDFVGERQYETQSRAWPRLWVPLVRGFYIDPDTVPQAVKDAQYELAYLIKGGLDPVATVKGVIKSAGAGPARVEFLGGSGQPRMVAVDALLADYVATGAGQTRLARG